jgi:hypothetical protein
LPGVLCSGGVSPTLSPRPVEEAETEPMPKLLVIMPVGLRTVAPTSGTEHDFDVVYNTVVKTAARQANWDVLRIDEVPEPGSITSSYLREIYPGSAAWGDATAWMLLLSWGALLVRSRRVSTRSGGGVRCVDRALRHRELVVTK